MPRILVVLEAGDRWPSGVVRGLAYRELFSKHGFSATFAVRQPLRMMDWVGRPPRILRRVVANRAVRKHLLNWATKASEQRILRIARNVDIVYMVKATSFPLVRALCQDTKARVVYDFVDAVWLSECPSEDFHGILRSVDAVTTDNELNADYARRFNASCTVVPDAPQVESFDRRRNELGRKAEPPTTLGWVGSTSTAYNLYVIWEALEELFAQHANLHLRLVGTGHDTRLLPPFEKVRFSCRPSYNQAEMIEEVFGMHIGLFPLQSVERSRSRGILKAAIYMSGEAVVVASPVGQCPELIQDGVNGMLAASTREWVDKLEILIGNADVRRRMAKNGLETVRSQFRLDQSFARLKEVLLAGS